MKADSFMEKARDQLARRLASWITPRQECARLEAELQAYRRGWQPGHFYSPIPALPEIEARADRIFDRSMMSLPAIDLNEEGQSRRVAELARYHDDQPFANRPANGRRYGFDNPNFGPGEAIALQAMMRSVRPKRVIEIGSGHSSAAMMDVNEIFFDGAIDLTFIDPYPGLVNALLSEGDRARSHIIASPIQDVDLSIFEALEENDILFVDSSHVSKTGSDVNHIYFEIFPRVKPGVLVHIHDIGYPFEYPEDWVRNGRAWNENYLLRAFLMYNDAFSLEYFASYWAWHRREELERILPLCNRAPGSSIWLQRVKS